ncbi:MAG: hypothetical protein ACTSO7_17350 [Candidatus Heimdallarchaeota archaeon]
MSLVLNWKTDPLLLANDTGMTLNALLINAVEFAEKVLLKEPLANFYGLLIKKQEFSQNNTLLTRTRILSRMPYLSFNHYPFLKDELAERSWLLAEKVRDY